MKRNDKHPFHQSEPTPKQWQDMAWIERALTWYGRQLNRLPPWAACTVWFLLLPVLWVLGLAYNAVAIPVLLVVLPYWIFTWWREDRRFWQNLQQQGRVAQWPEVEAKMNGALGTLIVELGPKGPVCSWLIEHPRDDVDPDHNLPSWHEFEEREWNLFDSDIAKAIARWTTESFGAHEPSARALFTSWSKLSGLEAQAKKSVLIVFPMPKVGRPQGGPHVPEHNFR